MDGMPDWVLGLTESVSEGVPWPLVWRMGASWRRGRLARRLVHASVARCVALRRTRLPLSPTWLRKLGGRSTSRASHQDAMAARRPTHGELHIHLRHAQLGVSISPLVSSEQRTVACSLVWLWLIAGAASSC